MRKYRLSYCFAELFINFSKSNDFTKLKRMIDRDYLKESKIFYRYHNRIHSKYDKQKVLQAMIFYRSYLEEEFLDMFKQNENDDSFKSNVLCRIRDRIFICLDESIQLIRSGYGISVISNMRLILECMSIAKNISEGDEATASSIHAFAKLQQQGNEEIRIIEWFKQNRIEPGDKKRIESLGREDFVKLYTKCCNYIHVSPVSLEQVPECVRSDDLNQNFPFGFHQTIVDFILLMNYVLNMYYEFFNISDKKILIQSNDAICNILCTF